KVYRVNRPAAEPHLVVEVGCGATPRRPHRPDSLSDRDPIAALHLDIAQVCVPRLKAVAVIDLDSVAVTGAGARVDHDPRRGRHHRRALEGGHVEARMEGRAAGEWIYPLAVT